MPGLAVMGLAVMWLACSRECGDECLANRAVELVRNDPSAAAEALTAIRDPVVKLAAGGTILADRTLVFDQPAAHRICGALRGTFEEAFCERRLMAGHLRSAP